MVTSFGLSHLPEKCVVARLALTMLEIPAPRCSFLFFFLSADTQLINNHSSCSIYIFLSLQTMVIVAAIITSSGR